MDLDGSTRDTMIYTSSGRGSALNPTPVVLLLLYSYTQLLGMLLLAMKLIGTTDGVDPEPKVPTLLYIGRRGRVIERVIKLTD